MNVFSYVVGFVVLTLIVGSGYVFTAKKSEAPVSTNDQSESVRTTTPEGSTQNTSATNTEDGDKATEIIDVSGDLKATVSTPKTVTVKYSKEGYSPKTIEINVGDTVKWVSDNAPMWTASNNHPTHTIYSEFDQKNTDTAYEFTFTKAGTWNYHNHLTVNQGGTVIVK